MAAGSLLALLDDITTVLDDVSVMTKVAAKQTAGVLGDDLALNAEQVAGVQAERELPVVWAVAKGSFINKLILVPAALLISAVAPWLITPLLMVGGAYLCFEGFEKIYHNLTHNDAEEHAEDAELLEVAHDPDIDMVAFEQDKIKGAIRTDFVLSAEIIVIALGTVEKATLVTQAITVSAIAIIMTIGVYGFVAGIVKLDDLGYHLLKDRVASGWTSVRQAIGRGLLWFAPWLMKALSVVGTAAMFLVGGGILLHGIPHAHDFTHGAELFVHQVGWIGGVLAAITPTLLGGLCGVLAGALVLAVITPATALIGKFRQAG
ncbi:MAG: DUF808 domain-containing protein [Thiothrix sp.]|uniref:DUF808 domain-containing protein n=1 Tax=Thiothrix sp. TaxID=1032 RepID=UPI00260F8B8D|nr:DUF808 domain-containing protein [Thiothrix sp.]MDD5391408.1 DUF808 domain-containing protein [Thiothrix sp.]